MAKKREAQKLLSFTEKPDEKVIEDLAKIQVEQERARLESEARINKVQADLQERIRLASVAEVITVDV